MRFATAIVFCAMALCCSGKPSSEEGTKAAVPVFSNNIATATFAGGCFWCMEPPFEKLSGVIKVLAGYTGGTKANPKYEEVGAGGTGHMESIQVTYDPARISYLQLLNTFWKSNDPTDAGGQFVDRGNQYQSAIFYHTLEQRTLAEATKISLEHAGVFGKKAIATKILPASTFYEAEGYHQDYYLKNPDDYHRYRNGSGRDQFLEKTWKGKGWEADTVTVSVFSKPPDSILKKLLSPIEYRVTQEKGTEAPFNNPYWNNHKEGIYVDIVTGEPLFSSNDKFESGTGWPSFTRPLVSANVVETNHSAVATGGSEVHIALLPRQWPRTKGAATLAISSRRSQRPASSTLTSSGASDATPSRPPQSRALAFASTPRSALSSVSVWPSGSELQFDMNAAVI